VFKTGTNEIHGSMFEFVANSALDANNFFNNRAGIPLADFTRHQYAAPSADRFCATKLFFFGGFEGLRQSAGGLDHDGSTAPTSGRFLANLPRLRQRLPENRDLRSVRADFRQRWFRPGAFANNVIPASALDPVGRRVASNYPLPTSKGGLFSATTSHRAIRPRR